MSDIDSRINIIKIKNLVLNNKIKELDILKEEIRTTHINNILAIFNNSEEVKNILKNEKNIIDSDVLTISNNYGYDDGFSVDFSKFFKIKVGEQLDNVNEIISKYISNNHGYDGGFSVDFSKFFKIKVGEQLDNVNEIISKYINNGNVEASMREYDKILIKLTQKGCIYIDVFE